MALAMYGTIVTELIGKIGGNVFQRGKFGSIMRRLGIPINPQTEAQMAVRTHMTDCGMKWDTLTDFQRVQWSNEAELYPESKKGRMITLSGFAFFSKLNRNLQEIDEVMVSNVPHMGSPQSFETMEVDAVATPGAEDITLHFTPIINADMKLVIYASPRMRLGNRSSKKRLRKIGVVDSTFLTGGSIKDMYIAKFGGLLQAGEKGMFEIKCVVKTSGYAHLPITTYAIGTI